MKSKITLFVLVLIIFSCNKSNDEIGHAYLPPDHPLIGYWIGSEMEEDIYVYTKAEEFVQDTYGLAFFSDSRYLENKNAGFCGTPPVVYKIFDGTWEQLSDSLYDIHVGYWGGTIRYQVEITSLTHEVLKCRINYDF